MDDGGAQKANKVGFDRVGDRIGISGDSKNVKNGVGDGES